MILVKFCEKSGKFYELPSFVGKLSDWRLCIWVEGCYTEDNICVHISAYNEIIRQMMGSGISFCVFFACGGEEPWRQKSRARPNQVLVILLILALFFILSTSMLSYWGYGYCQFVALFAFATLITCCNRHGWHFWQRTAHLSFVFNSV